MTLIYLLHPISLGRWTLFLVEISQQPVELSRHGTPEGAGEDNEDNADKSGFKRTKFAIEYQANIEQLQCGQIKTFDWSKGYGFLNFCTQLLVINMKT